MWHLGRWAWWAKQEGNVNKSFRIRGNYYLRDPGLESLDCLCLLKISSWLECWVPPGREDRTGDRGEVWAGLLSQFQYLALSCLISPRQPVLTAELVKEFNKTPFPLSVKIAMGGKLGKAHNTYVVSGGEAGGSLEDYLEDRRHSESDLNYSGGPIIQ